MHKITFLNIYQNIWHSYQWGTGTRYWPVQVLNGTRAWPIISPLPVLTLFFIINFQYSIRYNFDNFSIDWNLYLPILISLNILRKHILIPSDVQIKYCLFYTRVILAIAIFIKKNLLEPAYEEPEPVPKIIFGTGRN